MHKNKVVTVLKSLSADEMRQLDKFVRSPVHNRHEDVIRFFHYLRKHLNGGEKSLRKELVFENLFSGQVFDAQKLHYLSSYLLNVLDEYMAWQQWRNEKGQFELHLLRAQRLHHLSFSFEGTYAKVKPDVSKNAFQDVASLHFSYQLEQERFSVDRQLAGKKAFRLQEMSDGLDAYFIAEKLRNACILLSNQAVSKTSYDTGLLEQVLAYVEGNTILQNPLVAIYYHACRTLRNFEDDLAFRSLKELLTLHFQAFNPHELNDIFIFATNYCIRRINNNEHQFMREVFDIYQLGMDAGAFVQNGMMTPRTYSNIVHFGLRLRELAWVEGFIFKNKDALPEKQREGFFNYNLARFYHEKKNFSAAMPLLLQMDYEDVLLTCLGKILLAKMYLEQGEQETLSSLLQSFRAYLSRKKTLGYHRETFLNFIHFIQKLMHHQFFPNAHLKQEIMETKTVAEKEWLLSQL